VYRENEGVPYYMMRELAALKKIKNKHICELVLINLHDFNLHLVFHYIEKTLHDYMNPLVNTIPCFPLAMHIYMNYLVFSSC
jgi:cyclin-dependent kinase 2